MSEQEQPEHAKKTAMLEALVKSAGVVTPALKAAQVGRTTFYEWKKKDPAFAKAVADIDEVELDIAESQMKKKIRAGNMTALIFYLKTKGKARGWSERLELGGDLNHNHTGGVKVYLPNNGRDPQKTLEDFQAGKIPEAPSKGRPTRTA